MNHSVEIRNDGGGNLALLVAGFNAYATGALLKYVLFSFVVNISPFSFLKIVIPSKRRNHQTLALLFQKEPLQPLLSLAFLPFSEYRGFSSASSSTGREGDDVDYQGPLLDSVNARRAAIKNMRLSWTSDLVDQETMTL